MTRTQVASYPLIRLFGVVIGFFHHVLSSVLFFSEMCIMRAMDSAYLFTSETDAAENLIALIRGFTDIEINSFQDWKQGLLALRERPGSIIFVSETLPKDQFHPLVQAIRLDPMLEYISVYVLVESWTSEKINKWLYKPILDGWIDLHADQAIQQLQLKNGIQRTYSMKKLQKLTLDSQYIQNELALYDRKRKYYEQKTIREKREEAIELMHMVRTHLTVVKDGVQILLNEGINKEQKATAITLIRRNIQKIEEYVNEQELQIQKLQNQNEISKQFKIMPIQNLMKKLEKKLQYEASQRNISLIMEPRESKHSILLKSEDLEFMLMDLFQAALMLVKPGSLVYLTAYPLLSANTIELKWVTELASMEQTALFQLLEEHMQTVHWLDDKESKFEKILNADQIGFRFTLLRLT